MEPNRLGLGASVSFPGFDSDLYMEWIKNTGKVQNDDAQQRTATDPSSAATPTGNPFKENIRLGPATGRPLNMPGLYVSPTKRKQYTFNGFRSKYESLTDGALPVLIAPPQPEQQRAIPEQQGAIPPMSSPEPRSSKPLSGPRFSQDAPSAQANEALEGNDNGNNEDGGDVRNEPFKTRPKPQVMRNKHKYSVCEADDCEFVANRPNPIDGHAISKHKNTLCKNHANVAIRWQGDAVALEAEQERKRLCREEKRTHCNFCFKPMAAKGKLRDHDGLPVCGPCAHELDTHRLHIPCKGCHKMDAIFHAADNDELAESTAKNRTWCTTCAVTKGVVFAATAGVSQSACGALCKLSQELGGTAGAAIEKTHDHVYMNANGGTQVLRQEVKGLIAGSKCRPDAVDVDAKITYEFHGRQWHGHSPWQRQVFGDNDPLIGKGDGTASSVLYKGTMDRMTMFTRNGWTVKYIWDDEYFRAMRAGQSVRSVLRTHDPDVAERPLPL